MNLDGVMRSLQDVLTNPGGNLTAATLLAAAAALLILIVCLVLLVFLLPGARRGARLSRAPRTARPEEVGDEKAVTSTPTPRRPSRRSRVSRAARVWLAGLLVVTAFGSAYVVTSTDDYCAGACHAKDEVAKGRQKSAHPAVPCVGCHEDPLPSGVAGNAALRLGHAFERLSGNSNAYTLAVPSSRCVRCHADIGARVVTDTTTRVRMAHKRPLEAGMACVDCHERIGHGPRDTRVSMSTCIRCHDGASASAECSGCHTADTGFAGAVGSERVFGKVQMGPPKDCGGCHDQAKCDACHGLRMPHSDDFKKTGHARYAGFEKKAVCFRCHGGSDCGKCHGAFEASHGGTAAWRLEHQKLPKNSWCNTCHSQHTGSMCDLCHDFGG
jgi:nitrate/TMAO reductase-like tetraheme cytochrome c subunit